MASTLHPLIISLALAQAGAADEPADLWRVFAPEDVSRMYAEYMAQRTAPRDWAPTSLDEWERCREEIRGQVLDDLGLLPLPERVPLAVHRGGRLEREGYTVERIYWQTWPGYYAAGYLYMPTGLDAPAPAILHPHGHWGDGNRNPTVQSRLISLARQGYIGLTVDSVHLYDWARGIVPLTVMTWSNIRGIDLLQSLPEVDAERIGCTGCSGGGQQAMYLMAIEDRIKAAVTVGLVCNFKEIISPDMAHCACNHVPGIARDVEQPEMAAAFAPRPALFISMTGDWTARFPEEGYPEIRSVYELYGAAGSVASEHHESPHDYNQAMREQAYAFFGRWLMERNGPVAEGEVEPESLDTLAGLDDPPAAAAGIEAIADEFDSRLGFAFPPARRAESHRMRARVFRDRLARLLGEELPLAPPAAEVRGRDEWRGLTAEPIALETKPGLWIGGVLVRPEAAGPVPAYIVADPDGRSAVVERDGERWAAIARGGHAVFALDVRYTGEWAIDSNIAALNGCILGRSPGAVAAHDLLAAVAYLRQREDIDGDAVRLAGRGQTAVAALVAGCLDPGVAGVTARELGATYSEGRDEPRMPHILHVGDLPQIAACLAPRPLEIMGIPAPGLYAPTREAYELLGATDVLIITQ